MSTYTILRKTIFCPCLKENVSLKGKYLLPDNSKNPYEAKFLYATCPVVENSMLPIYKQEENYKYLHCTNDNGRCEHLDDFPKIVDLRKTTCI